MCGQEDREQGNFVHDARVLSSNPSVSAKILDQTPKPNSVTSDHLRIRCGECPERVFHLKSSGGVDK